MDTGQVLSQFLQAFFQVIPSLYSGRSIAALGHGLVSTDKYMPCRCEAVPGFQRTPSSLESKIYRDFLTFDPFNTRNYFSDLTPHPLSPLIRSPPHPLSPLTHSPTLQFPLGSGTRTDKQVAIAPD